MNLASTSNLPPLSGFARAERDFPAPAEGMIVTSLVTIDNGADPHEVTGSLPDAVRAANELVLASDGGGQAQSVWQVREGTYFILPVGAETSKGVEPYVFDAASGEHETPNRFVRTEHGKPDLQAIVGAQSFARFDAGDTSQLLPLN